jgi:hypothetical protein
VPLRGRKSVLESVWVRVGACVAISEFSVSAVFGSPSIQQ